MKGKKTDVEFYENSDFSGMMMENSDKKRIVRGKTRRITMNISGKLYDDAHDLDKIMGMGYQNVLKTAIVLGLRELGEIVGRTGKGEKK